VSQVVVVLYLIDSESSLIVVGPALVAIVIQCWKVWKATGLRVSWQSLTVEFVRLTDDRDDENHHHHNNNKPDKDTVARGTTTAEVLTCSTADSASGNKEDQRRVDLENELVHATLQADRFATGTLTLWLLPVVLAVILQSLVFEKHRSWYSWCIRSLTSCVYTFGFVFMIPQLYINYQLKSVSHLPWNVSIQSFFLFRPVFSVFRVIVAVVPDLQVSQYLC
jgi:hypothetical protein